MGDTHRDYFFSIHIEGTPTTTTPRAAQFPPRPRRTFSYPPDFLQRPVVVQRRVVRRPFHRGRLDGTKVTPGFLHPFEVRVFRSSLSVGQEYWLGQRLPIWSAEGGKHRRRSHGPPATISPGLLPMEKRTGHRGVIGTPDHWACAADDLPRVEAGCRCLRSRSTIKRWDCCRVARPMGRRAASQTQEGGFQVGTPQAGAGHRRNR